VELTLANDHATNSLSTLVAVGNKMEFVPTLLAMLSKHTSVGQMYRTLHLMAALLYAYWIRAIKTNIIRQWVEVYINFFGIPLKYKTT